MRLRIDGVEVPLADKHIELPSYDIGRLRSCEAQREGDTLKLTVLVTRATERLFGFAEQAFRVIDFNDSYHYGELILDGVVLFSGLVHYCSTESKAGRRVYNIEIIAGGATWADKAATTQLNESNIDAVRYMDLSSIYNSWGDDNPIKFLPLREDSHPEPHNTGLYEVYHPLLPQDYHPFISVKALVNSVVSSDNYTLNSRFMETPFFEKLMISGAYRSIIAQDAYASMGFKAVRSASSTATADTLGRVDVWVPKSDRNIGAFVDTVSATTIDESGNPCMDAYTNGGCFSFDDERPIFRPKREVSVAFDLHFSYTTDYRIISSKWLQGFTKIYIGSGCYVDVSLPNTYIDRRNCAEVGVQYKLFIFDYDPTAKYRIAGIGSVDSAVSNVLFKSLSSPMVKLFVQHAGSTTYVEYDGDWALYDGYVEERGERSVEFTLRTPYNHYSPTSPKLFNEIYFEGAEQGQRLTLHAGCSITPVFGGVAGYGDKITLEDISNYDISQAQMLDAVAHMFNLCIYTHRPSKSIIIEPYDDFFSGDIVDWRGRQRHDNERYEESVVHSFMLTELGYQNPDGAVGYCYGDSQETFGSLYYGVESYAAKQSLQRLINPLFHPTASFQNSVGTAPSAEILTVGDREVVSQQKEVLPRIILYHGLIDLPTGECWPSPYCTTAYPYAAFHSATVGQTLCFEDRDGVEGLHRFYDNQLKELATRQMLTTDIYLPPEQYVQLYDPYTAGANIRSRFRLNIEGSSSLFRLDAIENYDPVRYIARCRFQRLSKD